MFQRLYELSQCLPQREAWERLNEGMPDNYNKGFALCFDAQGQWVGVRESRKHDAVVYRGGSPNGTNFTPCYKLSNTTKKRLISSIEDLGKYQALSLEKRKWLASSLSCFKEQQEQFWQELEVKQQEAGVDKDNRCYVYWADAHEQAVYAWPEVKQYMVDRALEAFSGVSATCTGTCNICGIGGVNVYGNYAVIASYNLDKPGSIAGGFNAKKAHRNFPVCASCALSISETFTFVGNELSSNMAGQSYLVLPYSNNSEVREELHARFAEHPDRYKLDKHDLIADEMALIDEFASSGDQLAMMLIFYEKNQASWRIQAEVTQLLPSRLHKLQAAAVSIGRAADLMSEHEKQINHLQINGLVFKNFSSGSNNFSADTLRNWLVAIFSGKQIDIRHFLSCLVAKLLDTGKREPVKLRWMTRCAWGLYRYARLTDLIIPDPAMEHPAMSAVIPNSPYGNYVVEHADFFCRPELVVAFLTGCYASQVASVQRQERGADPFTKKFIGRMLGRVHLQRLYREGHNKLAQYGKLGYVITGLDPDLANAWVACGDDWKISDEAATFAFTIGYSLAYRIGQLSKQEPTHNQLALD